MEPLSGGLVVIGTPYPFEDAHAGPPPVQPIEPLTDREEQILIPVARGWTNAEIADELYISISTVKTHLASVMRELDARNRVAVALAAEVEPEASVVPKLRPAEVPCRR